MKKIIALLLVFVLALSFCACGNKDDKNAKYVGTYSGYCGFSLGVMDTTGWHYGAQSIDGTRTLTLNSDGTGTEVFIADVPYLGDNITVYECEITWEVVDDYLYVSGSCNFHPNVDRGGEHIVNDRYTLEGKTLVDADYPDSMSGKLTKK